MLLHIPSVLAPGQCEAFVQRLQASDEWVDGRATAGHQGRAVKHNRQLAEGGATARELGDGVLAALETHASFIAAALPRRVYPPLFNRYAAGMAFGDHVDGAIRQIPGSAARLRTDLSFTLFLSDPHGYDGGELVIAADEGGRAFKLPAGDLLLYESSTVHRVEPVRRGERLAAFSWVESMVRDGGQRHLLLQLDRAVQRLAATDADVAARVALTGVYHNLLRLWADA